MCFFTAKVAQFWDMCRHILKSVFARRNINYLDQIKLDDVHFLRIKIFLVVFSWELC